MNSSLVSKLVGLGVTAAIVGMIVAAQFWAFMPPTAALATTATPSWTKTPTQTPPNTYTVSGHVCDLVPPDCGALAFTPVRLVPPGLLTQTDAEGQFRFIAVPNGTYAIEIGFPDLFGNYKPLSIEVNGADVDVTISPEPPLPPLNCGDANGDGRVTSIDAGLTLQYVVRLITDLPRVDLADANGDGDVASTDALLMLQMDAGLIDLGLAACGLIVVGPA